MTKPAIPWMSYPWTSFDTETTGVDVENDFILSAAVADIGDGAAVFTKHLLLNWEIDVPPESAKIHGLTRERLSAEGLDPATVLEGICLLLAKTLQDGVVVGMNLAFDLTMLDRNCRVLGVTPLADRCPVMPIADAFVLDKYVDPYRRGKRNLAALAGHYRTGSHEDAHDALADALMAARVCWRIGKLFPGVGAMDPILLHELQAAEKKSQDASFRKHLLSKGQDPTGVDGIWPWKPPGGRDVNSA